jgi:hypothetical protein
MFREIPLDTCAVDVRQPFPCKQLAAQRIEFPDSAKMECQAGTLIFRVTRDEQPIAQGTFTLAQDSAP